MEWIIFTAAKAFVLEEWNAGTDYKVRPRQVTMETHPLYGKWVARVQVTQGDYAAYWADKLADYPRKVGDPAEMFLPLDV